MDTPTRQRHHKSSTSRSTSPVRNTTAPYHHPPSHHHHQPHQASISSTSSRWQQLVVGAGSAAGTTAAVISEESMKCLKYCLSWLQYATQHIEQQMHLLKNYLVSLASNKSSNSLQVPTTGQQQQEGKSILSGIKKDIVETLRKVVEVITRYAGASLPTQARYTVRGFILNLPGKWANLNDIRSTTTSPAASPMLGPTLSSSRSSMSNSSLQSLDSSNNKQEEAAIRLLSFGQESVEMLNSVSTVFSDTVDRAELWIDRLKMVPGLNKGSSANVVGENGDQDMTLNGESVKLPPIRTLNIIPNISNNNEYQFDHS